MSKNISSAKRIKLMQDKFAEMQAAILLGVPPLKAITAVEHFFKRKES